MHFEIFSQTPDVITAAEELYGEDGGSEWRWALKSDNGETIATGEGFESEAACRRSIDSVKATGPDTAVQVVQS